MKKKCKKPEGVYFRDSVQSLEFLEDPFLEKPLETLSFILSVYMFSKFHKFSKFLYMNSKFHLA